MTHNEYQNQIDYDVSLMTDEEVEDEVVEIDIGSEDEEDEYEFYNYGEKDGVIQVAGGGMMNGNAFATVELIDGKYWYCEYGKNAFSEYRGLELKYKYIDCGGFDILEEKTEKPELKKSGIKKHRETCLCRECHMVSEIVYDELCYLCFDMKY